jgi:ketosteroid isomerase-like protein
MSPDALVVIARTWLECFARADLDGLLALYAEDAVHTSPKIRVLHPDTGGLLVGKPALRAWWQGAFARLPGLHYEERTLTAQGDRVFMEYVRHAPGEPDLPVAEVLVVGEAGLITASRVFHG